jgi:hypothetical protein
MDYHNIYSQKLRSPDSTHTVDRMEYARSTQAFLKESVTHSRHVYLLCLHAQRALNIFGRMLSMRKHYSFLLLYFSNFITLKNYDYKNIAGQADLSMIGASRLNDVDIGKMMDRNWKQQKHSANGMVYYSARYPHPHRRSFFRRTVQNCTLYLIYF